MHKCCVETRKMLMSMCGVLGMEKVQKGYSAASVWKCAISTMVWESRGDKWQFMQDLKIKRIVVNCEKKSRAGHFNFKIFSSRGETEVVLLDDFLKKAAE